MSKILDYWLKNKKNKEALTSLEKSYTWEQLEEMSNNLAANYIKLWIKPGDRFASLMPNCPELFIHYIACFKINIISVLLNIRYKKRELYQAVNVSNANFLLIDYNLDENLKNYILSINKKMNVVRYNHPNKDINIIEYWDLLKWDNNMSINQKYDDKSPCWIYFTSWSTWNPKWVTHSNESLYSILLSMNTWLNISPDDIILPVTHFSTYLTTLAGLFNWSKVLVAQNHSRNEIISLMTKYKPTIFGMLPAWLFDLINAGWISIDDFKSVRACLTWWDKLSKKLNDEFKSKTWLELLEWYWMTEVWISHNNPVEWLNKFWSIWKVLPGYECSIRDEYNKEVIAGEVWELWIKSSSNMIWYWNNKNATNEAIKDWWFKTWDLMMVDSDWYYWFKWRKKNILINKGSNVYPDEIEEALLTFPNIENASVVSYKDNIYWDIIVAFVKFNSETDTIKTEYIKNYLRENIAEFKVPKEIIILDSMPITSAWKIDKIKLLNDFLEKK